MGLCGGCERGSSLNADVAFKGEVFRFRFAFTIFTQPSSSSANFGEQLNYELCVSVEMEFVDAQCVSPDDRLHMHSHPGRVFLRGKISDQYPLPSVPWSLSARLP